MGSSLHNELQAFHNLVSQLAPQYQESNLGWQEKDFQKVVAMNKVVLEARDAFKSFNDYHESQENLYRCMVEVEKHLRLGEGILSKHMQDEFRPSEVFGEVRCRLTKKTPLSAVKWLPKIMFPQVKHAEISDPVLMGDEVCMHEKGTTAKPSLKSCFLR